MPLLWVQGDITKVEADAIVNAANETLLGGGGVDGAIHRAAGPGLLAECRTLGGCRTGDAKLTGAYGLNAKYVIHTVGPIWRGGENGEKELLASCYRRSMELALEKGCTSVAFPMISTGVYGYPMGPAMEVASKTVLSLLATEAYADITVSFVLFDRPVSESRHRAELDRILQRSAYEEEEQRRMMFSVVPCRAPAPKANVPKRKPLKAESEDVSLMTDMVLGAASAPAGGFPDLDELMLEDGFQAVLIRLLQEKGMKDSECYRRSNISRQHFNKLINGKVNPSRQTVLAIAIGLRLNVHETEALMMSAGYAFTQIIPLDAAVRYFIRKREYDINQINIELFEHDLPLLGRS